MYQQRSMISEKHHELQTHDNFSSLLMAQSHMETGKGYPVHCTVQPMTGHGCSGALRRLCLLVSYVQSEESA